MKPILFIALLAITGCEDYTTLNGHNYILIYDDWLHDPECEYMDMQELLYNEGFIDGVG